MDKFNDFYYKIIKKNNNFCLMDNYYRQLPWNKGIFSTHSKSKKKLPYGSFFSLWKRAVENTDFWVRSFLLWCQFINKSNIIYFFSHFIKIKYKNFCDSAHGPVLKVYCLWTTGHKKTLPYGSFFLHAKNFRLNTFCIVYTW